MVFGRRGAGAAGEWLASAKSSLLASVSRGTVVVIDLHIPRARD